MAKGKSGARAGVEIIDMADDLLRSNHREASEAGVTTAIVLVAVESGPALTLRGQACAATIQVVPWEYRLLGLPDCLMRIDAKVWERLGRSELHPKPQLALLDHELTHIEVKRDKHGEIRYDAAGRPVVGMRPHDFELGVFKSIIDRYGEASIDAYNVAVTALEGAGRQLMLPLLDGSREIVHPTGMSRAEVAFADELDDAMDEFFGGAESGDDPVIPMRRAN
jgi:hypothetical protein